MRTAVRGAGGCQKHRGHVCFHIFLQKNALDHSDGKSEKWSKVREKSGNFARKIVQVIHNFAFQS